MLVKPAIRQCQFSLQIQILFFGSEFVLGSQVLVFVQYKPDSDKARLEQGGEVTTNRMLKSTYFRTENPPLAQNPFVIPLKFTANIYSQCPVPIRTELLQISVRNTSSCVSTSKFLCRRCSFILHVPRYHPTYLAEDL